MLRSPALSLVPLFNKQYLKHERNFKALTIKGQDISVTSNGQQLKTMFKPFKINGVYLF